MEKQLNNEEIESLKSELNDKYLRLYAEFENYKKRSLKEKEELRNSIKINTLSVLLDIDNDLSIAYSKVEKTEGIELIMSKLEKSLKSEGIEVIQSDTYDPDVHEVVSIVNTGKEGIYEVVSRGYTLNGKIIRYPKVILSK
jgi:molecular chaperone GrpE